MLASMLEGEEDIREKFEKEEENPPALLFAPDCIHKDGKYYLYFCMKDDSEGVAVSEHPAGPFRRPTRLPVGGIDPAIFIDEDGQAYYYWGQLFAHGVKLNADMCSFAPEDIVDNLVTEEEHFFHEGSSMRKIGDNYYYVYADMERGKPTSLGYSMGKSPLGPFEYKGIIIDNDGCDPQSWNNHGSIECFEGQWYVFYHRCSRNSQLHRRLCIEKIFINEDGTIDEVKMTSQGIGEPFGPGERIMGYQACGLTGSIFIGEDAGYEEKLTGISDGDTATFRYVKTETGFQRIAMTVSGTGKVAVLLNGICAGMADVSVKDGVETCAAEISSETGEFELTLRIEESDRLELYDLVLE